MLPGFIKTLELVEQGKGDITYMADTKTINQSSPERWISAITGGGFITYGLLKRSTGGYALAALGAYLMVRGASGHCPGYAALGVSTAEDKDETTGVRHEQGIRVMRSVTIDMPAEPLFAFWRQFDNLPKFMYHLERVDVLDGMRSHWVAKAPLGKTVEWNAHIINEKPNQLIAWQTDPGADVDSAGAVTFKAAPGGRGTEVHVSLSYMPPAGAVGAAVAKLFGEEPSQQIEGDLRRFKMLMETGEIATTQGQSAGKRSLKGGLAEKAEAKMA